jgi:hypothetical protein
VIENLLVLDHSGSSWLKAHGKRFLLYFHLCPSFLAVGKGNFLATDTPFEFTLSVSFGVKSRSPFLQVLGSKI